MHGLTVRHKSPTPGDRHPQVRREGLTHDVGIQWTSRNTLPHAKVDRRQPGASVHGCTQSIWASGLPLMQM